VFTELFSIMSHFPGSVAFLPGMVAPGLVAPGLVAPGLVAPALVGVPKINLLLYVSYCKNSFCLLNSVSEVNPCVDDPPPPHDSEKDLPQPGSLDGFVEKDETFYIK
jgi:hypothetical protein